MNPDTTISNAVEQENLTQQAEIIAQLQKLNGNVERQLSLKHILFNGIVYGLSFAIGSTILFSVVAKVFFPAP
jgi:hypothetical protein